jgi:SNF2 family DNA or RNA helicase
LTAASVISFWRAVSGAVRTYLRGENGESEKNILKPFLLRRCKKDVIKDLPLKKEYVQIYPTSTRRRCKLT